MACNESLHTSVRGNFVVVVCTLRRGHAGDVHYDDVYVHEWADGDSPTYRYEESPMYGMMPGVAL